MLKQNNRYMFICESFPMHEYLSSCNFVIQVICIKQVGLGITKYPEVALGFNKVGDPWCTARTPGAFRDHKEQNGSWSWEKEKNNLSPFRTSVSRYSSYSVIWSTDFYWDQRTTAWLSGVWIHTVRQSRPTCTDILNTPKFKWISLI